MKIFIALLICVLVPASGALAYTPDDEQIVTEKYGTIGQPVMIGSIRYVDLDWITSTVPADADTSTITFSTTLTITGRVIQIVTDPDTTTWGAHVDSTLTGLKPADNYDVTILTADGEDILGGAGLNRDDTNTERVQPIIGSLANPEAWVEDKLTLYISNIDRAGARGRVRIMWENRGMR